MDDAFTNGRPPTSAERAAWGRTYEHLTGRMKLEVRQEVGAAKISASATRLRDEFGATHIDPVTGKPLPNVARAADEFTKDANKLLKGSTGKDVKWDAFAGDLRSLENRFGRYLEVQRGADAAAARAVARFDEVVAARPKGVAADPSRVAALRAELKGAARDAYVSAAGSKSLFRSGDASADLLNKQAATWLRHRDNLIDIRLNWLEQTQHNHARFGARQIGLDHYTSLVRGGVRAGTDEAAEAGAAVRRAYQMVESRSGSFAHNMRPEASVFVRGELGRMAYQAPQQARFGTHAANLLEKAQAQIKTEVAAGERAALNRDLTVTGSAGRVTADATADLVKAGEAAVKNMRRDNFDPDLVAGALADLRRQTDDIVAGVRGRVVDDAALFTADIRADRMIAAEVGGQRATFGQGTRDLYLNRFKQDVLTEFRQTYGTAARPDVAAWLRGRPDAAAEAAARNTLDDLFPKPAVTPDPVTPGTGRPPGAPGGPGIQVFHVRPEMPSIDPTRLSGLLRGEKTDLFPGVDVRGGVPGKGFVDPPGGLPGGTKGDPVMPGGGRPAGDKSPAYELRVTDDVPVSRPGPRNDDPPTYQQARDGDELPSYETARLDPPPAPTRADVQQWMTENAAGAGRSLRMPSQQLDSPMSGLERMIEKIRGEQRDGIAGQVEGLGRVDRPDVKPGGGKEGDDPLDAISRPRDPEAELRDMAWNAMNKYEADLRQTLGDGIRPGSEGGGFAGGPATPARSGQSVAGDFRRFLGGAPEATAIQQRLRDLGNEELDRAHSWLRHQDGPDWAVARGQLDGEWQLRYDRGDLEPGIGTMGAHEALRRLAPPSAPRTVDLDAMRADYLDKARISARIQDLVDRTAVQQAALQDALRRQNLGDVGPRTGAGLQPFESIPARVDELQEMHVKITAAQISGDARVIRATEQLELIVRERAAIAGAVTAVDQAIIAAEKQLTTQFTDPAVRDADPGGYAAAHVELARLRTWREQGLSSFEPAADPARAAMYQRLQNQGLAPALRSPETGPPVTDGRSVLSLMDDLETAIARLGRTPTPQPHDPEWVQTVGQRAADDAVADWVEAYGRVHRTWNDLPMWQRQGPQIRDASLAHFERTAVLQRERAILDVTEPATNSALRQADGQAQRARTQLDLALRERERAVAAAQFAAREAERAAQAATRPVPPPPRPADVPEPVARPADVPEPVARPDDTVPPPIPPSREIVPPPADTKPVTPGGGGKPSQADSDALVRRFQALRNEEPEIEAPPPVVPGGGKPSQADSDALVRRFQALRNAEPEAVPGVGKPRQADADALVRRFQELRGNTPAPVRSETSPTIPVVDLQARFDALRGPKPKPQTDPAAPAPQTDPVVPAPQTDPVVPAPQTDPVVPPPAEQTAPAGTSRQAAAEDLHARFEALRNPSGLRFDDPVRHGEWQTVRAGLIRDLGARFGNARAIDELVPRVETDFVRVLHHTPGTGRLPETRIAEQFTTFTDTVGRAFGTALSGAFSEVRPPTAAERAAWRQRYDELRADLTEDLRRTVGAAEIDRVAEDTFVRWQEADPGLTAVHNEALRHWSRDALQRLDVHHQSRNWSYAENALRDHIRLLDVYRTMHLGAARAADRVGARFDEKLAGRDPFADAERVQQSRAEAVAAAYDRYLGWWRPSRMHHAIADPAGLTARADRSFDVHGDAIGVRLDYLDETQEILDYVNRATTAELLPRSMSVLDEKQLAAMARSVRLEAESLVNRHANPFTVAVPPELTGSWLKRVRIDVTGLVDRIPARAAFAARAAELTGAALPAIGARAADGVAEALSRGLDPTDSFVRVSETARRELMEHVAAARDGFAARGYADGDLAKTLADLEAGIAAIVGRVRIETIRDALLRRGDTEAAGTLGEHAVRPGELLGATVRDRLLNDFEQTYVQRYHDQFADGGRFDVEAWLRTTPPWTEPPRATEVDGPDPVTGGGFVTGDDALVVPAVPETPGSPVVRPETGVGLLPEPEQAAWQERLRAAGDGPALDDVRGDLLERVVEVNAAHQANRTALESMADRFRQAIGQTRPHPVTPAETDWLVRGFLQNTTGLTPRDTTDSEPDVQYPVVSTREPVAVEWGTPVDTSAVPIEYPVVPSTDPRAEAIDRALAEGFQRLFESVIKPLPHRVRETFRARWLAVREDLEAQSAIRQEAAQAAGADWVRTPVAERYPSLTTHQAEEFGKRIDSAATLDEAARIDAEAAAKARARAAAPPDGAVVVAAPKPVDKPAPVLDKIDREYAGVAPAERDRLRQVIANARTPQRLDQAYAELDALRDAAVAAANPKPGPTAEERIRELARAVPRHGYRAVGPDTPPITAAQAAAYEDELGRLPIAEIGAWEVRLFEAGYQRVGPADGSGTTVLPEMPHVPVHDDEIVGAYRAWARDQAGRSGAPRQLADDHADLFATALSSRNGTGLAEALDDFTTALLEARVTRLNGDKSTGPREVAPVPAGAVRADSLPSDPELDAFSARLEQLSRPGPVTQPGTTDDLYPAVPTGTPSRTAEDTAPADPFPVVPVSGLTGPGTRPGTGGGSGPDISGMDPEVRRMAEAEGRLGPGAGTNLDDDLARRLARLRPDDEAEPAVQPGTPAVPETPATPTVRPQPGPDAPSGTVDTEMVQPDGTVTLHRQQVTVQRRDDLTRLREQLTEDAAEARTEAETGYRDYLSLDADLRARGQDLATRFRTETQRWQAANPGLADRIGEPTLRQMEQSIADRVLRDFFVVRETLDQRTAQRELIADLIAEQVAKAGPRLDRAASRAEVPPTAGPRVDPVTAERFEQVVREFRRADLFGGRWLNAADYARLRDDFTTIRYADADALGAAAQRLTDELAVAAAGNRWFQRIEAAVQHDRGDDPQESPIPQAEWYRVRFLERLRDDYVRTWGGQPPGTFANGALYQDLRDRDEKQDPRWVPAREDFTATTEWLRQQLTFAAGIREVLVGAARDFDRLLATGGAGMREALTTAALAERFRTDAVRLHLSGRGQPADALDAWLQREKADTDVFGTSLAAHVADRTEAPAAFTARAEQVTGALLTEYTARVRTAAEVASRRPDLTAAVTDRVTEDAGWPSELTGADRDRWREQTVAQLGHLHRQVWRYAIQVGATVGSEHWEAAAQRWNTELERFFDDLRVTATRQVHTDRLAPALEKLRTDATAAGLSRADTEAVAAAFAKTAADEINRGIYRKVSGSSEVDPFEQVRTGLQEQIPDFLEVARIRAGQAAAAARELRDRVAGDGLADAEVNTRANEVADGVRAGFDEAYRQFQWADPDHRLAQAGYAADKARDRLVTEAAERPATTVESETVPPDTAQSGRTAQKALADLAEEANDLFAGLLRTIPPTERGGLRRVAQEIQEILDRAEKTVEDGTFTAGGADRAVAAARTRITGIVTAVPERLAQEQRLAAALETAGDRFDDLPGARDLEATDPLRQAFLSDVAGRIGIGNAGLTSAAQHDLVRDAAHRRRPAPEQATDATTGAPAAETTITSPAPVTGTLPTVLPPVEVTPLTSRPPDTTVTTEPPETPAITVDPETAFRADLAARAGDLAVPAPVENFPAGLAGEQAQIHWSLETLAHHGGRWLDEGVRYLDEPDPAVRARYLVDAALNAPADALLAFSRLSRGVGADAELDLPVAIALQAMHLALHGEVAEAENMMRTTWKRTFPSREGLIEAIVGRDGTAADRAALQRLGIALVTC
ncbi:MAG TPA: hypothetical protein VN408_24980 [Actinoplanes sp.]|nr:hypothetical protein [Actinoplanes sp.]